MRAPFRIIAIFLALQLSLNGDAQVTDQSVVTLHKTAQIVAVDVVVMDKSGSPIRGLTQKDFHLFEAGIEQPLSTVEEHGGAPGRTEVVTETLRPGVYTNEKVNPESGPLCVILIDSLNTALADQSYAHSEMVKLAQSLPAGSRIAVFRLGSKLSMLQSFTDDTASLAETLNGKNAGPEPGPFYDDADLQLTLSQPDLTAGMGGGGGGHTMSMKDPHSDELSSELLVSMTLRSLRALGLYLSALPGRKNLVWISGSFPIDVLPSMRIPADTLAQPGYRQYMSAVRDLALLLQSGNVALYPIDVHGLTDGGEFDGARSGSGGAAAGIQSSSDSLTASMLANMQIRTTMRTMADLTGGRAFFTSSDIAGSIAEALKDGSNYYSLAYVPLNRKWDGKFRKLAVHVDGKDLRLSYRQGYYAEDPDKPRRGFPSPDPSIGVAMERGMPEASQIKFQLQLKPDGAVRMIPASAPALQSRDGGVHSPQLTGTVRHYSLTYSITPADLSFLPYGEGQLRADLTFSAIAYDAQGKMLNSNVGALNSPISQKAYEAVTHDALRIHTAMNLPLERVYLRVGVHDRRTDKIGTMEIPLDVETGDHHQP
jgi:VWFA-related protein